MRGKAMLSLIFVVGACGRAGHAPADQHSWCRMQPFESSRFTVCDNEGGKLQLFAAAPGQIPLRSFADVATKVDASKVAFAMNAGMFDENGRPIGLAIVGPGLSVHRINLRDGPGNFQMKPNGVFEVDASGRPSVIDSGPMPPAPGPALATQSGPMLVIHGRLHPKIEPDGESRLISKRRRSHCRWSRRVRDIRRPGFIREARPFLARYPSRAERAVFRRIGEFVVGPARWPSGLTQSARPDYRRLQTRGVSAWSRRPRQTLSAWTVSKTSWTRMI